MFGENTDEKRKKERSVCYFSYDVCYFSHDLFVGCCFVVVGVFVGFFSLHLPPVNFTKQITNHHELRTDWDQPQ